MSSVMRSLSAGDTMMMMMVVACASQSLVDCIIQIGYYNVASVCCLHCFFRATAFVESAMRRVVLWMLQKCMMLFSEEEENEHMTGEGLLWKEKGKSLL